MRNTPTVSRDDYTYLRGLLEGLWRDVAALREENARLREQVEALASSLTQRGADSSTWGAAPHDAPSPPVARRPVAARSTIGIAVAMLVVGFVAGSALARPVLLAAAPASATVRLATPTPTARVTATATRPAAAAGVAAATIGAPATAATGSGAAAAAATATRTPAPTLSPTPSITPSATMGRTPSPAASLTALARATSSAGANGTAGPSVAPSVAPTVTVPAGWVLTFEDEFNGRSLNPAKWNNVFDAHAYNGELQLYTPANVRVEDGHLRIESQQEAIAYQGQQYAYTSGRIDTNGKFSQLYGRFEVRARLPMTRGVWPAHWLLPTTSWPPEIDIMELLGHDPTTVYLSNHWGTPADHSLLMLHYTGPNFAADFHTFAVEWEPGAIRWLVDGVVRASTTDHIPAVPMYLILNTAIGGTFPAYPDASTVLPQVHDIDYVRVYRRA